MTEPIAVDVPAKPVTPSPRPAAPASVASTLAGVAVGAAAAAVLPVPVSVALPKVDSPPRSADPKPAPGTTADKPPEADPAKLQAAEAAPTTVERLLAKFTKRQLTIGASAVFSLVAGIGAVRMMFPAKEEPRTTVPTASLAAAEPRALPPTPAANAPEPTPPLPKPRIEADPPGFSAIPNVAPVAPPLPSGVGAPTVPLPPPTITPLPAPAPFVPPVAPSFEVPAAPAPVAPNVFPASGTTPTLPIPAAPATPPVAPAAPPTPPALPPLPGMGAPAAPTAPATPPVFPLPTPPGGMGAPAIPAPDLTPPLPMTPSPAPALPAVPPTAPAVPPVPLTPPSVAPLPMTPAPTPLAPPSVTPVTPPAPPSVAPGAFPPVDVVPKPEPPKVAPNFDPPGVGTPAAFTKPGGATDVKPIVATSAPKTDFDVDLYDPKANDSYESISQDVYNDKRYAAALKAFNRNQQLQGGRLVELPPIYVLKRRFPNVAGGAAPSGGTSGLPTSAQPNWGPAAGELVPAEPAGKRGVFVVPAGPGMTLRTIARQKLGGEQRWRDLYDLNVNVTRADEVLPAGTEVKLPADAR